MASSTLLLKPISPLVSSPAHHFSPAIKSTPIPGSLSLSLQNLLKNPIPFIPESPSQKSTMSSSTAAIASTSNHKPSPKPPKKRRLSVSSSDESASKRSRDTPSSDDSGPKKLKGILKNGKDKKHADAVVSKIASTNKMSSGSKKSFEEPTPFELFMAKMLTDDGSKKKTGAHQSKEVPHEQASPEKKKVQFALKQKESSPKTKTEAEVGEEEKELHSKSKDEADTTKKPTVPTSQTNGVEVNPRLAKKKRRLEKLARKKALLEEKRAKEEALIKAAALKKDQVDKAIGPAVSKAVEESPENSAENHLKIKIKKKRKLSIGALDDEETTKELRTKRPKSDSPALDEPSPAKQKRPGDDEDTAVPKEKIFKAERLKLKALAKAERLKEGELDTKIASKDVVQPDSEASKKGSHEDNEALKSDKKQKKHKGALLDLNDPEIPAVFKFEEDLPAEFSVHRAWKSLPAALLPNDKRHTSGSFNPSQYCYMNTALQTLAHCPQAVFYLAYYHTPSKCKVGRNCMSCLVRQFMMRTYENKPRSSKDDVRILERVGAILGGTYARKGYSHQQSDAGEALSLIIERCNEQMKKAMPEYRVDEKAKKKARPTPFERIFTWKIGHTITCHKCKYQSSTQNSNTLRILTIPFDKKNSPAKFTSLINTSSVDQVDGWKCPSCKKAVRATKKERVFALPPFAIVNTSREVGASGRHLRESRRPLHLATSTELRDSSGRSEIYHLTSLGVHMGSMRGGHWVHYGRQPASSERWAYHSDQSVSHADFSGQVKLRGAEMVSVVGFSRQG